MSLDLRGFHLGAHAARADIEAHGLTVDRQSLALDIRLEGAVSPALGEAHIVSECRCLAANFTSPGHQGTPFQRPGDRDWNSKRFGIAVSLSAMTQQSAPPLVDGAASTAYPTTTFQGQQCRIPKIRDLILAGCLSGRFGPASYDDEQLSEKPC